jgi:hypothetical protein
MHEFRNDTGVILDPPYNLSSSDFTRSNPYYEHRVSTSFNVEGRWPLSWKVRWSTCIEKSFEWGKSPVNNGTYRTVRFTVKSSAQQVDLIAMTGASSISSAMTSRA